jgi:hypothetical protein
MGKSNLVLAVGLAFVLVQPIERVAAANIEPAVGWKLVKQDEKLVLYERDVPGSDVIAFRGEGLLEAPIAQVAAVLLDDPHAPEWVDSLEESRVLRHIGPMEFIEYNHIGTPFIMKDRDFVTDVKMEIDPKARTMALRYKSVDDPSSPQTSYVRGDLIDSLFLMTSVDGKKTTLRAEIHCDPKGSVPKWIVNLFQRSWPSDTFDGIRKQLKKPGLGTPAEFKDVISQLNF